MSSKKIKYTLLTIFVLLSCSGNVHAQLRDTLAYLFKQRPKPFFQLDGYNSFVRSRGANAIGFKTGLDFGKRVKFSMGYMKLFTDVVDSVQVKPNKYYRGEVRSNYFTTGIEYVIYRNGPWQVNVPMHFGFGTSYYEYPDGKKQTTKLCRATSFSSSLPSPDTINSSVGWAWALAWAIVSCSKTTIS